MLRDMFQMQRNYWISPARPLMAVLYITDKCNLQCGFCEMGSLKKSVTKDIETNEMKDIISQLAAWGVRKIYMTGGEPFARKDIWELMQSCVEKRIQIVRLTTNGTLLRNLTDEKRKLLKDAVSALCISLDSTARDEHDKIRGVKGTYDKIIELLNGINQTQWPALYLSTVLTNGNICEIPEMIKFASMHNIKHVNFQPLNFESNFPDFDRKDKSNMAIPSESSMFAEHNLNAGLSVAKRLHVSTNIEVLLTWVKEYYIYANSQVYFFDKVLKNHLCSKPFNYIHIDYRGDLLACSMIKTPYNVVGRDIKKTWRTMASEYKQRMLEKKYFHECHSCFCDFPTNYRESLVYHPIYNRGLLYKLLTYYVKRISNR